MVNQFAKVKDNTFIFSILFSNNLFIKNKSFPPQ